MRLLVTSVIGLAVGIASAAHLPTAMAPPIGYAKTRIGVLLLPSSTARPCPRRRYTSLDRRLSAGRGVASGDRRHSAWRELHEGILNPADGQYWGCSHRHQAAGKNWRRLQVKITVCPPLGCSHMIAAKSAKRQSRHSPEIAYSCAAVKVGDSLPRESTAAGGRSGQHDRLSAVARNVVQCAQIAELHRSRCARYDLGGLHQLLRRLLLAFGIDDFGRGEVRRPRSGNASSTLHPLLELTLRTWVAEPPIIRS